MTNRTRPRLRLSLRLIPLVSTLIIALLALSATVGAFQVEPTEAPPTQLQANPSPTPTQRVPGRQESVQINPTEEPTREIDDLQANPTVGPTEPPRGPEGPDDFQANPTAMPTREPIDDLQAEPTTPPVDVIDDEAIPPGPGSVTVSKRDCPLGVPEDAMLSDYIVICSQLHDGIEFTLETSEGAAPATTQGGQVQWTGLPPGEFQVHESVPDGYQDPIVFCGFTESPGGGVQHPSRQEAADGSVGGSIDVDGAEYVCYWFNLKQLPADVGGPGDVADPSSAPGASVLVLQKHTCPHDVPTGEPLDHYLDACSNAVDGIQFTMSNDDGESIKPVTGGQIEWTDLPVGPYTIQESIPFQYGEPIVFCGWTAYVDATIIDAFAQPVEAANGQVSGEIVHPGTYAFCFWMNVESNPNDLANPDAVTNHVALRVWDCPHDIRNDADMPYYYRHCSISTDELDVSISDATGDQQSTGHAAGSVYDSVPAWSFAVEVDGLHQPAAPIVFCEWSATSNGSIYSAPPTRMPATDGVVSGGVPISDATYHCEWFDVGLDPANTTD